MEKEESLRINAIIKRSIESVEEEAERAATMAKLTPVLSRDWGTKAKELETAVKLLKHAYGGLIE